MKRILLPLLALLMFPSACKDSNKEVQILDLPTSSIQNDQYYASYCIYHLEKIDPIDLNKIKTRVADLLPTYQLVDSLSSETGNNEFMIDWFADPKNEYPAPDLDYLKFSGHNLSSQEMSLLQSPFSAVSITFSGTNKNVIDDQISINNLISSLLNDLTIVTDYTTYESFNRKSWNKDRVANFNKDNQDITSQYTIHLYRENEFCRAVTLGLGKFCLPDVSIQSISCHDQRSYGSLINLVCQTWIENPVIREDSTMILNIETLKNDSVKTRLLNSLEENASKKALINLLAVQPQEGDAYNSQFELVFNDNSFSSIQEHQQVLISQIFGVNDQIEYINHDERILQASQRAKDKLPELKDTFNKGLEPGYSILLKAPFETDNGGREWMWIEVTEWKLNSIKGILQNDPFEISNLKAGAIVSVDQEEVFDYIFYNPDGTSEGNETGKILSNRK